jgi:transposase
MLSFHAHLKVFLATAPCDLRMNFNGLWAAAQERLGEDPKGGALFVFGNRRHNRIKILYFDGTWVCVLAKRLEEGTFHWPRSAGEPGAKIRLAPQALQLLLDGVDLKDGARRAWYESATSSSRNWFWPGLNNGNASARKSAANWTTSRASFSGRKPSGPNMCGRAGASCRR